MQQWLIEAWGGVLAYTLQLYFDFSGYSDMAIGLSKMINIDIVTDGRYTSGPAPELAAAHLARSGAACVVVAITGNGSSLSMK